LDFTSFPLLEIFIAMKHEKKTQNIFSCLEVMAESQQQRSTEQQHPTYSTVTGILFSHLERNLPSAWVSTGGTHTGVGIQTTITTANNSH